MLRTRLTELLDIEHPLVQAPMAGSSTPELAAAVSAAGGLGSLPCALLEPDGIRAAVREVRARTSRPFNLNFFCHATPLVDPATLVRWQQRLAPYYEELGLEPPAEPPPVRRAFDEAACEVVLETAPAVVSFHFGLPDAALLRRLAQSGCRIFASATTVAEARWLAGQGCDAVIAQGTEAGGHRGIFLTDDVATQAGTIALVPQVVDALDVPVIAAGGIGDARGIAAALALGAAGVQLGTSFLRCAETGLTELYRRVLAEAGDDTTVVTNVFTGRPARGIANRLAREVGPLAGDAPPFPLAAAAVAPLRAAAERSGSTDFSAFLFGQAAALGRELPAGELVETLMREAAEIIRGLAERLPAGRGGRSVS